MTDEARSNAPLLTPEVARAAMLANYKYVWKIEYVDGSVLQQFRDDLTENRLDFERPIRRATWQPVDPCLNAPFVDVPEGAKLCIFRRNFNQAGGPKYTCYGLGIEEKDGERKKQRIWYLTPSFIEHGRVGVRCNACESEIGEEYELMYPGSFETSNDPDFVCYLQRWMTGMRPTALQGIREGLRAEHQQACVPKEAVPAS